MYGRELSWKASFVAVAAARVGALGWTRVTFFNSFQHRGRHAELNELE